MKAKSKASTPTTGRRGRKPGDGVLKQIDPLDHEATARKLFCGKTADDPIANMVRWGQYLAERIEKCAAQGDQRLRWKEHCEKLLRKHNEKFAAETLAALAADNADWFRKVASAMERVKAITQKRPYPLHEALFFWRKNTARPKR